MTDSFTPVKARRGFDRGNAPPPPPPTTQPPKIVWPDALRSYVQRAFDSDNDVPGVSPNEMQDKLKLIIQNASVTHNLHNIDWSRHPLPQQLIQFERTQQFGQPQLAGSVAAGVSALTLSQPFSSGRDTNASNSKKRKSGDNVYDDYPQSSHSPWRRQDNPPSSPPAEPPSRKEKRRKFQAEAAELKDTSKSNGDLEKRRMRFNAMGTSPTYGSLARDPTPPLPQGDLVGTCQVLEKPYFRLTSAPKPSQVRPLYILEQTLEHLRKKWAATENYNYICEQFKSMRQDLSVQHIRNAFTVKVYESHARFALEKGDLGEYNQCQTQLRPLYAQGIPGKPHEFLAYRILYFLYTEDRTEMNKVLAQMTEQDLEHDEVKHALQVRRALSLGNYHRFFKLWGEVPNMGGYLVDMFVERERLKYIAQICKGYKQDVFLRFVTEELCFEDDAQAAEFICKYGAGDHLNGGGASEQPVKFVASKAFAFFDKARVIKS